MALELHLARPSDTMNASEGRLVDLVDGLLDHGVVLRGELHLSVADVDLVFIGLDLVLTTPEKMRGRGACNT